MTTVKSFFYLILYCVNLNLVISDDELYKKFHQTDYKINLERQLVSYINESFGEFHYSTFKYNRTHFVTNATFLLNVDIGYDLVVLVQAYKFLSNEYRVFPMHFQYNFCKGFKYNFAGIKTCAEKCGNLNCPLKKNIRYIICNCLLDESKFPPLMPNGRFKLVLEGRYKTEIFGIIESYMEVYRPILPDKHFG